MPSNVMLLVGSIALVGLACIVLIAWRLRGHFAQRADAERRAAVAFEELTRLTKELRGRRATDPEPDASLSPGQRLLLRYPGTPRSGSPSPGERR